MNYNSSANQNIKSKFVGTHVIHNCSCMINELSRSDNFNDEVMQSFYSNPDYDAAKESYVSSIDEDKLNDLLASYGVDDVDDIDPQELCDDMGLDYGFIEPYEFWIVSDYLGEKLKNKGQIVEDFMGFTIWGRQTTGQAILLDYVISQICEDMQILEGQTNEWKL